MVFIYVLKLNYNKYYVGKTNKLNFRLEDHFNNNGSYWTQKYRPIAVIEIIPNCDDYDEDKFTRKYMDKFGINNVRGGSFTSFKLSTSTTNTLKQMSCGTNGKCYNCGKRGHFAKDCYYNMHISDTESETSESERGACYRCGRYGHYISECYARTHANGYLLHYI